MCVEGGRERGREWKEDHTIPICMYYGMPNIVVKVPWLLGGAACDHM